MSHKDIDLLCAWSLATRHSERVLRLPLLGTEVLVDLDQRRIQPAAPEFFRATDRNLLELLSLVYLMGVTADRLSGEMISVQVAAVPTAGDNSTGPIPEEEREAIKARVKKLAREIRAELPEPWRSADHGDLLYGEDGLPK